MFLWPAWRSGMARITILLLAMACVRMGFAEEKKPDIDPAADERLRTMSEYVGKLERFSVDVLHTMETPQEGAEGDKEQDASDERRVVIEQPNRLAVTGSGDSEGQVVCDGKQLFAYWPSAERYVLGEAPETFAGVLSEEAALLMGAGRTAVQLATGDWYRQAMTSATSVAFLEPEQLGSAPCDRIEISQRTSKIVLWIEQGERPLLHKMKWELQLDSPNAPLKMPSQVVTYSNWKLENARTDNAFAIDVPDDAEQVETLTMQAPGSDGPHPLVGAEAPDCELTLLEGGAQKLAELKDAKVVVLDFWALWCGPCLEALPSVDKVAAKFADRDVAFFAVNLGDDAHEIREFLEKQELNLPIAIDPEAELGPLFQADSIPMTVLVDKQGVVQVVRIGYDESLEQTLSDEIEAVLAGKQLAEETLQAAREARRWGEPIPAGDDAKTAENAVEDLVAFNLRTSVEAYKKVGKRDQAWDDAAIEFLTESARHFAGAKGCKSQLELVELAEPLIESGCDDPLVKYCHGAMLLDGLPDAASQSRGLRFVEQSYHGLAERGYPANRCFAAAFRMYRTLKDDKDQAEKTDEYLALTQQHAVESVLQDDLKNNDGRTLYDHLNGFAMYLPLERRKEFCEAVKVHEEKSPYVVGMLVGEYHIDAAWAARGNRFAPEVTEEGWTGFGEHMESARQCFERAWEAAPARPEAATAMVKVAMGSSRSPLREMRMWFDRAVQAQLDYRTAYSNLIYALLPRWHGSHELMYEFGVECMETERYDTDIPYELCAALWRIMQDDQNPLGNRYAQRPGLYENVRTVCQRYIEQEGRDTHITWWKTVWLGFAYLANQWEDAAQLLEELDSDLDPDALGRFPLAADEVVSTVRLHASPHAEAILKAFEAAEKGQGRQAAAALEAILAEKGLEPSVATQVATRLQGLNWTVDFQEGGPVSLSPAGNLHGWKAVAGTWSQTPNGELRGVSDAGGLILECQAAFGVRWQIRGEVTHGESPYNPWDAGILLTLNGRPEFAMMFNPTHEWVAVGPRRELKNHQQPFKPQGKTTRFVMRVEGDTVSVWLNGELVIEDQKIQGLSYAASSRVAIGAKYTWEGSALTYRNLEIERIPAE